jgi:putative ABC transport system permease protein
MGKLVEDLKYAVRMHAKAIAFTVVALGTLSLGIGASTAVFSAVNAILLKPLPYPDPQRIVIPWHLAPKDVNLGYNEIPWGTSDFRDFLKMKSFESVGAFKSNSFNLTGLREPVQLGGLQVSSGFFAALGTAPFLGRTFIENEDSRGRELEAILSYQLWQDRFHGDPGVLGRGIDLNGLPHTVIGVMPPGFAFPRAEEMPGSFDFPRQAQVWVPLALPASAQPGEPAELAVVGRLRRSASIGQAQAEMNLFTARMERETPESKGWFNARVTGLTAQAAGDTRKPLLLILGAVGVLLLIACANVANLLLARSLGRGSEFALRAALGAGKLRLVRQLLTESSLISLGGGAAGVLFAALAIHLVKVFGPANIPRLQEISLDWRVLAFAFAVSSVCGALFGLAPMVGSLRDDLAKQLRHSGRGTRGSLTGARLRSVLLVAEIGLAFVLVVASGLLVRTFFRLLDVDPGFNAERVLTFELSLPGTKYKDNDRIVTFYQKALRSLRTIPGVAYAGIVEMVPMAGAADGSLIRIPDRPAQPGKEPFANYSIASSGYFSAVGTPLLLGRDFLDSDTASSTPVVIVNAAMAKKFWPGESPIGKRVGLASVQFPLMNIIGVAADVKHLSLRENTGPEMYVPFTQKPFPSLLVMHVALRTTLDAASLAGAAREAIRQLDPDLPIADITTLRAIVDASLAGQRFSMLLLGAFGALSLALASIGLYGVISYSVSQRTREIGIRMALGAARTRVFAMVIGQAARLTSLGVLAGLLVALGATRLMANVLYGVQPADTLTFAIVAPLLGGVALLACYAPAHRATRVDPIAALRHE